MKKMPEKETFGLANVVQDYGDEADFQNKPETRATTFLLDPRVLDDTIGDGVKDVEIVAPGLSCIRSGFGGLLTYVFMVEELDGYNVPLPLSELSHERDSAKIVDAFFYQKANLFFSPVKKSFDSNASYQQALIGESDMLYLDGQFLKGDLETFKKYGIKIK